MQVRIQQELYTDAFGILFAYERDDGKLSVAQPVELVFQEYVEGEEIKPTLRIGHVWAREFFTALAEALDREGVKTEQDAKIQGRLDGMRETLGAVREHLHDMQTLLGLRKEEAFAKAQGDVKTKEEDVCG